jgi:DNA-binding transcriptional LysR family regulator
MGISQPAVSKLLRQAERGLGLSLMVRDGNRVVPTLEADTIRKQIDTLFGAFEALQRLASSMRTDEAGQVSIAAVALQATRLLPLAIQRFKAEFPSTMVRLHVLPTRAVIGEVTSGQADFGLVHSFTSAPELETEDFGDQIVVCIAPARHRYKHRKVVRAQDMLGERIVLYTRYSTFSRWIEDAFKQADVNITASIEVTSSQAMIELVRVGAGVGLLEGAAVDPAISRKLIIRPFSPELRFTSRILRPFGRPMSGRAERLLAIYREVVSSGAN